MKLSAKSDYAARAVLGLARRFPSGESVRADDLAAEQGIPPNYLVQILIELKFQNIVRSLRGKEGGYMLARPPAEVTLGDIILAIHGQIFDTPALSEPLCPPELKVAWKKLQTSVEQAAEQMDFQKLIDQGADKEKMYYI